MTADTVSIELVHGADLHTAESKAVLAGLMAYNAAKTPTPVARLGLAVREAKDDAWIGGVAIVAYADAAYSPWGLWTTPAAVDSPVPGLLLGAALAELRQLGVKRLMVGRRAHAPNQAYEAAGARTVAVVPDHIRGGDLALLELSTDEAAAPAVPQGLSLEVRRPPSDVWAQENWKRLDQRRMRNIGVAPRWVTAYVRDGEAVRGGAICYAVGDEFMVDMVWLDEALRGTGLGARMLTTAIEEGRRLGCRRATVETMDFQAAPFYRRVGFADLAYLPDLMAGFGMTALRMSL